MASHGAAKQLAVKERSKKLVGIMLKPMQDGKLLAEHHYEAHPSEPVAALHPHELAAHATHHFGISMPGKSKIESAEETEGDEE